MKIIGAIAMLAVVASSLAASAESSGTCSHPLEFSLESRANLAIDSRPAGIEIVGTDQPYLRVTCTVDPLDAADQIALRFSNQADVDQLTISGGPLETKNLHIRVEVPHRTNLLVHTRAGQVIVEKVAGDKDIDIDAGQITVDANPAGDYRSVDAAVTIGEVRASAYGVQRGGFFRSFTRHTPGGEYRLRARVLTGQIELK